MRPGFRYRRIVAILATAALCALGPGCATTSAGAPRMERIDRPHAEPDLVVADADKPPPRVVHRVEAGQTLYRIALTYGISVETLMAANGIHDPRTLAVGQVLVIPGAEAPKEIIPPGAQEAPEAIAAAQAGKVAPEHEAPARVAPPKKERKAPLVMPKGDGVLDWPLRGVIYARFGRKGEERHDGIDLAAPLGTPVKTAKAGRVLYAGEQKGYGLIVIIDHGDDLITLYAHNRDLRVKTGQRVRDGQVVATVGESGRTSGPHLHFEVRKGGVPTDPLGYLGAPPERSSAVGRRVADHR
ncbi:MAG: M23 family metallopeptidase [Myxococcaceae bacterium]|nr:M23 family metallopeptidase [Myxococcaceae bacterium]